MFLVKINLLYADRLRLLIGEIFLKLQFVQSKDPITDICSFVQNHLVPDSFIVDYSLIRNRLLSCVISNQ